MGRGRVRVRQVLGAPLALLLVLALAGPAVAASTPPPPSSQWQDVQAGSRAWFAKDAINGVAGTHDWMRDYGRHSFRPVAPETREQLARAVVRAFAPTVPPKAGV